LAFDRGDDWSSVRVLAMFTSTGVLVAESVIVSW
jgi:hypothetical protein